MATEKRYYELDSLRGVAAMTVVFHHFLFILPSISDNEKAFWYFKYTPLHLFWAAHEAVIFFFLLSGFVLSLQFFGKKVHYSGFFIKRICRIYIPYLAAVTVAVICSQLFYSGHKPTLSIWFNSVWTEKPTLPLIANHLAFITDFHNGAFDPVLWSLVHEMRISLLFPLIIFLVIRFNWKTNVFLACLFSMAGMVLHYIAKFKFHYQADFFMTIHYIAMFIFGALLAKHRVELVQKYQSFSQRGRYSLVLFAIPLYLFGWIFQRTILPSNLGWFPDWIISAGVAVFIISAIGSDRINRVLLWPPIHFLGKTSYSVYLFHAIILFCLVHSLYATVPIIGIWMIGLVLTILISTASFKYVELPSIAAGRILSDISKKF
ncbi:MAG: acyltransferase [Sedimentisphaerales bacterium]|jgi:peptidoglycan/LPS O-acetylase OafA/YrhL